MPLWMYFLHPVMVITFFYQQRYSSSWDKELCRLIGSDPNPEVSRYTITFKVEGKRYEVWIENRYYSYGYLIRVNGRESPEKLRVRPSFNTMRSLARLERDINKARERDEVSRFMNESGLRK